MIPYYRPPQPNVQLLKHAADEMKKTGMVSNSVLCRDFEAAVKDYHNVRYALACSSATTGLILALRALRARTGATECIMPSFTWKSCLLAAECAGLRPMFADVEMNGWMMEPVTQKQIIMPVSIFGASIRNSDYKGHVLLDAAHAVGTPIDFSGITGAVVSFAPSKLITCGEGGMLLTDDSALASEFALLRDKFGRMSEMNAALGLAHWGGLEAYLRDRKNRFQKYLATGIGIPQQVKFTNYSTAAFRTPDRDRIVTELGAKGIETRVYYEPLWKGLPNTDQLFKEVICLPNWYACPTDEVLKAVTETIHTPGEGLFIR